MAIPVARVASELDQVYCPFTGQSVHSEDGINSLPSLLFVYYGNAGEYAYISDAVVSMLKTLDIECTIDDIPLKPEDLAQALESESAFVLEIDAGWNGIDSYAFVAP